MRNAVRMSGLCFTCLFCGSVACFNNITWHSFKDFFQVTTILSEGQLNGQQEPLCEFDRQLYKIVSKVPRLIDVVTTYNFLSNGTNHLIAHYCV